MAQSDEVAQKADYKPITSDETEDAREDIQIDLSEMQDGEVVQKDDYKPIASDETDDAGEDIQIDSSEMQEYADRSAGNCFLNKHYSWCTCRCCGLAVVIVWLMAGAITFAMFGMVLLMPWHDTVCTEELASQSASIWPDQPAQCCGIGSFSEGVEGGFEVVVSCGSLKTACAMYFVHGTLQTLVAVLGIIGFAQYISILLTAPLIYSGISVLIFVVEWDVVVIVVTDLWAVCGAIVGIVFCALMVRLFHENRKIMNESLHR